MRGGFSFCGVDIVDLGLEYAPELADTYVYQPAETNIHEEIFDSHHGGHFYGATRVPKEFLLRCIFQEHDIDKGIISKINALFRKGKTGRLVFQRMPWLFYNATVVDSSIDPTNYRNGIFNISMKAYYPYARCDAFSQQAPFTVTKQQPYAFQIMANSAAFDNPDMELPLEYNNITQPKTLFLANIGTEAAALGIGVAGNVGAGVTIGNRTTGQVCRFIAITKANTTNKNAYVYLDSLNGKTILVDPVQGQKLAFKFRHYGALELAPAYPVDREIYVTYDNSNTLTVTNIMKQNYIGKHIFLNDKWYKIVNQTDDHTLTLSESVSGSGTVKTTIMLLNEIYISASDAMDLDRVFFKYKATFA